MEAVPSLPSDLFRAFDELTKGEYAPFAGCLARPDDPRPSVLAGVLLDSSMKAAISARFAGRFQDFEPRAAYPPQSTISAYRHLRAKNFECGRDCHDGPFS
jgi:hypothetical protein